MSLSASPLDASLWFDDECAPSATSDAQRMTEASVAAAAQSAPRPLTLARDAHIGYLVRALDGLSSSHLSLDASRPWLLYWALHSLDLLGARPTDRFPSVVRYLARCQCAGGGFGGGPGQLPHTAATYAAVLALAIVGGDEALGAIDTRGLRALFASLRDADTGGFRVQPGGEMDVRGAYTVLAVAHLTGLMGGEEGGEEGGDGGGERAGRVDASGEGAFTRAGEQQRRSGASVDDPRNLARGTADFLLRCQSYEGGFGGEPGNEAHGGYTYCAVAGLSLLRALHHADVRALRGWVAARQLPLEGGLQGRTHKLVDSCYSFWIGAVARVLEDAEAAPGAPAPCLLDAARLQSFLLAACQAPEGGMRDKPGKPRDLYHTCYALSGLALAQGRGVLGGDANALARTHPLFNIRPEHVQAARAYFTRARGIVGCEDPPPPT